MNPFRPDALPNRRCVICGSSNEIEGRSQLNTDGYPELHVVIEDPLLTFSLTKSDEQDLLVGTPDSLILLGLLSSENRWNWDDSTPAINIPG